MSITESSSGTDFAVSLAEFGACVAQVGAVFAQWLIRLSENVGLIMLLSVAIVGGFYWQTYSDQLIEVSEWTVRCIARPLWLDPIRPVYEILQPIYNRLICFYNAANWVTFGVWRQVVVPLLLNCDIKPLLALVGGLVTTLVDTFVADFIATGDFLAPWPYSAYDWGPGSNPFDITGPGMNSVKYGFDAPSSQKNRWQSPGTLCPEFVTLWAEWINVYSCICFDLAKFLRLQPLIMLTISLPPVPYVNMLGLIASEQIGDPQMWAGVGHLFNAAINLVQQIWRIATWVLLYLVFPLLGGAPVIPPPGSPGFPRPSFRIFSELICQSASALVRSIENAAQRFVECFLPFPFDFTFFFCLVDTAICVAIKLVAFLLNLLFNVDRLGIPPQSPNLVPTSSPTSAPTAVPVPTTAPTPVPTPGAGTPIPPATLSLWESRFRDDWMEIINLIAPVSLTGWQLSNSPGSGTSIEGMRRLSECVCIFLQRLLCDPSEQCTNALLQPVPCECYGNPVPAGVANEFSICCIVEAALVVVVDLLAIGMEMTYNTSSVLSFFLWYDQKMLDHWDSLLINDLVGENGLLRCIGRLFRTIPEVGPCIEALVVDFVFRVAAMGAVFIIKFVSTALVTNLVFALAPCVLSDLSAQPQYSCILCTDAMFGGVEATPSLATPCFPRGWLLTPGRARDDWERIWKPIIIHDDNTDLENFVSAENCMCAILNMVPIPRLPCTNCKPCGYSYDTGAGTYEFIECVESPLKTVDRTCADGLAGPKPGQGIVRDAWASRHMSRSRRRVDEITESLRAARAATNAYVAQGDAERGGKGGDGADVNTSPFPLFQRLNENARRRGNIPIPGMMTREDIAPYIAKKRARMMRIFHESHERAPATEDALRSWTKRYMDTSQMPGAPYDEFAPPGVERVARFDDRLADHEFRGDVLYGRDPDTGAYHKVDERIECDADGTMPGVQTPGCFDVCCYFKRALRFYVRFALQTGDFFDALFFGQEQDPMWQYFVGPESDLYLAEFETQLIGLLVEYVEISQCICNVIELVFPIPFLDLCCSIIAAADLVADVLLTVVKGIKSLALDNRCLNPRLEQLNGEIDAEGTPVFTLVGDICANGAVAFQVGGVGDYQCCLRGDYSLELNACATAPNPPVGDDPSMGTQFQCRPERDNFSYFTKPVNEPGNSAANPFPGGAGPQVDICVMSADPLLNEESALLCDCCREGQSQFECDIDKMSDGTIVIVVCLCDIIRAMLPIPGLDLCCAVEAILIALIEVIRFVIQLLVNLGTINSTGADFFKVTPAVILYPDTRISAQNMIDHGLRCPTAAPCVDPLNGFGSIEDIGLVVQLAVIFDTIFGIPGGRCAKIRTHSDPPQFSGGEAEGGAITCVCQILNWIIPARKYPSLAVDTCPDSDPGCDNCPVVDLCCWFRETGFFVNGVLQFSVQFVATFWQDWILGEPQVVIDYMFCDEYGEWDPSVLNDSAVGGTTNVGGNFWGPNGNSQSELITASCGRIDPILSSLRNLLSDCPCTLLKFVDDLLGLVFGGDPGCFCGEGIGLFRALPDLVIVLVRRGIQFLRMFWSKDFWLSPDGGSDTSILDYDPATFPAGGLPVSYPNQSWSRWFIWPIANQVCLVALSFLCIPDLILGAIFGCRYARKIIVAAIATWPFEGIIVALELVEGIAETFAGSCGGDTVNTGDIDAIVNGTSGISGGYSSSGGGLAGVDANCVGGAIVGLFQFPIDFLFADGELPFGVQEFADSLLTQLPSCVTPGSCPPLDVQSPARHCRSCQSWCDAGAPECKCTQSTVTQPSSTTIASATGFNFGDSAAGVCIVTIDGFLSDPLVCDCGARTMDLGFFTTGTGTCSFDADAVDCALREGDVLTQSANNACRGVFQLEVPQPIGVRRVSGLFMGLLRYIQCIFGNAISQEAADAMFALVNLDSFLWQLSRKLGRFIAVLINFAISILGSMDFLGLIGQFFDVIGAAFNVFSELPITTGSIPSVRRRRGSFERAADGASFAEMFDKHMRAAEADPRSTFEGKLTYAHIMTARDYHHRVHYNDSSMEWAAPFLGYDTSDCTTDPVSCICRNMESSMKAKGMCHWDTETDTVVSMKYGGGAVTPNEAIHALGESCAGGTSPCDILMNRCGEEGWAALAANPALLYMWAECVDLRVAGEEIHAVDDRFPSNFFHSHSGFVDLLDNVRESARKTGARWRKEGKAHRREHHRRQRALNPGGLTDAQYDERYMTRTLHSYVAEYGEPQFPELASVMLRLDLKLHHITHTGRFRRKMMAAYHGFLGQDWVIPTDVAYTDLKRATRDLGKFIVTRKYRENVARAVRSTIGAVDDVVSMTKRHAKRVFEHGVSGWASHNWRVYREMNARSHGLKAPRTEPTPDSQMLIDAFYAGPAYKWWQSSWSNNTNPFRPFIEHIARVRRVQRDHPSPHHTSVARIVEGIPNPWTAFKAALWKRWAPKWDWRLPHWPSHKRTPDRWRDLTLASSVFLQGYDVLYPDSLPTGIRKRFLIGPDANCPLIADSLALIVDTFDYCVNEYTFNLPFPDCVQSVLNTTTNTTEFVPIPGIECGVKKRDAGDPYHHKPARPDTALIRYLDRTARHRTGFLRDRTNDWHHHNNRTHMVWKRWNERDPLSYVRPRIEHHSGPEDRSRFANIHPHQWARVVSFATSGANLYFKFFMWVEGFTGFEMSAQIAQFVADFRVWIENTNVDPDLCGLPGPSGVGLLYWTTFPIRCEWPHSVNCASQCGIGLKRAIKLVTIYSLIIFGGVSAILPFVLAPLTAVSALVFYIILIPAVAWHYPPQCWLITPSIPIPGVSVNLPIFPVPVGLPVLPECLLDDIKALIDDLLGPCPLLANFAGIVPLCMYNGNPCPSCPDRIDIANCVNVGVADGISNLALAISWISPSATTFISATLSQTCYGNGCIANFFPFNLQFLTTLLEEFESASDTQQCRQHWCFWATIISLALPALFLLVFGYLIIALGVALVRLLICGFKVVVASGVLRTVFATTPSEDFDDDITPDLTYAPTSRHGVADLDIDARMPARTFHARRAARASPRPRESGMAEFLSELAAPIMARVRSAMTSKEKRE